MIDRLGWRQSSPSFAGYSNSHRSRPSSALQSSTIFLAILVILCSWSSTASAQQLIPSTLPACAQQCTALQQGQTGCVPAGGAPVTNSGIYQSCFCQSALLTQLYSQSPVQLCTSCSSQDMSTIQTWYQGFCGKGGSNGAAAAAAAGGNDANQLANGAANKGANAGSPTTTSTSSSAPLPALPTQPTTTGKAAASGPSKPWITNHWQWLVMLFVLIFGLGGLAFAGTVLHRRYHARRTSQWSTHPGSQPDITTWGPGQSVHDLRYGGGAFSSTNVNRTGSAAGPTGMHGGATFMGTGANGRGTPSGYGSSTHSSFAFGYGSEKGKMTDSVRGGMTQVSTVASTEDHYSNHPNGAVKGLREKRISSGRFF